jgi:D-alanine-D-alanine ligase
MRDGDNHPPLDRATWTFSPYALVEEYIKGREVWVAVLDGKAQGVTELRTPNGFMDYEAKYFAKDTEYLLPAPVPADVAATLMDYAERIYRALGCQGLARCDMRYDDTLGVNGVYFLEINTQPGFTSVSVAPSQVIHNGMSFSDLCAHLVETATCKSAPRVQQALEAAPSKGRAALG